MDGFTYNVKMPGYLRFTGNLGIKAYQGGYCAMIIWSKINGENEYGVFIADDNGKAKAVELTSDLEAADYMPEEKRELVERYRDEIDN
ncbi:hypothetical protein [Bacteroides heparinolyticus]|uniref:hypothetical protein n=1 Tax=Prevotella heparinolytica TaxID=28113 RepID=UPI0035A1861E